MTFLDKISTKNFIGLIIILFLIGASLMTIIQYNSAKNIDSLIDGNSRLLKELQTSNHLREIERDIIWIESRIRAAIATDDITHLEGVDLKVFMVEKYLDSLQSNTADFSVIPSINRLREIAREKKTAKHKLVADYKKAGKMDNIGLISNPRARFVSNEISDVTKKIYSSRQKLMSKLSSSVERSGRDARFWGTIMISFLVTIGFVFSWFIISRIKHQNTLIQQLDYAEKKTRQAALVKENFLANMSHEIRTPLNSILGFTNLLKHRIFEEEAQEFVYSIQKAGENLLSIINDILDLSKIEAGMMRIEKNPFSIRGLFDSIRTLFHERISEKKLELKAEIDVQVPDTLIGDATRLTQIFVNLIGNSIKFTEHGQIFVHIFNRKISGDRIELGVSISDTGIGIEESKLEGVFDRFHQAEDSTTRNYGGTGLGLSIVRDLLNIQKGNIRVASEFGKGTTFSFYIPYVISSEQYTERPQLSANRFENYLPGSIRILVVDDNEMNQSLMKHLLRQWELSFEIVGNGVKAIEKLEIESYDLVLMDIQMPIMDGYATTQHIRTQLRMDIPIIAMTAHALAGEREKCISYGMNEYLSKPINERQLFLLISRFCPIEVTEQLSVSFRPRPPNTYKTINLQYLRAISKGNMVYERKATKQFISIVPIVLNELRVALQNFDLDTIHALAHNLKTTVSIMGMNEKLSDALDYLEAARDEVGVIEHAVIVESLCLLAMKEAKDFEKSIENQ